MYFKRENKTLRFNTYINNTINSPPQTIMDPNTHRGAPVLLGIAAVDLFLIPCSIALEKQTEEIKQTCIFLSLMLQGVLGL